MSRQIADNIDYDAMLHKLNVVTVDTPNESIASETARQLFQQMGQGSIAFDSQDLS